VDARERVAARVDEPLREGGQHRRHRGRRRVRVRRRRRRRSRSVSSLPRCCVVGEKRWWRLLLFLSWAGVVRNIRVMGREPGTRGGPIGPTTVSLTQCVWQTVHSILSPSFDRFNRFVEHRRSLLRIFLYLWKWKQTMQLPYSTYIIY
jgi:hypothetical protein